MKFFINMLRQGSAFSLEPKTLYNKTFQLFIALTMKSEDGEAVISLRFSRLAVFAQHCKCIALAGSQDSSFVIERLQV